LLSLAVRLNKLRNHVISLAPTYATTLSSQLISDDNHLCLVKGPSGSQIMFCINNKSSSGDSYQMSVGGFAAGDSVIEVLGCTNTTADALGNITTYMSAGAPKVYALASAISGTGLCNTTVDAAKAASTSAGARVFGVAGSLAFAVVLGWAAMFL